VEEAMIKRQGDNKTVQDYLKDLENIKNLTPTYNVFRIVLIVIAVQFCYFMLKIFFTTSHNIKPLFPAYKTKESTKRSHKCKQKGTSQELAPIRHEKGIETNIGKNNLK
jgi:hypothetical protein